MLVGAGVSYREAAADVRRRAGRMPLDENNEARYSRHGQLVADWVELFAPVVNDEHWRSEWPSGTVVVDEVSFRTSGRMPDGKPKAGGGSYLFRVYAAMPYDHGFPEIVRLQAFRRNTTAEWTEFLQSLSGAPDRLVADGHDAIAKAARSVFPDVDYWVSEWHLEHAVERMLIRQRQHGDTRFMRAFNRALLKRNHWEHFTEASQRSPTRRRLDRSPRAQRVRPDRADAWPPRSARPGVSGPRQLAANGPRPGASSCGTSKRLHRSRPGGRSIAVSVRTSR